MSETHTSPALSAWRGKLHEIIFEADTVAGKLFDVALLITIVLSILVVMLESVSSIRMNYEGHLRAAEWVFTILFTVEYVVRLVLLRANGAAGLPRYRKVCTGRS